MEKNIKDYLHLYLGCKYAILQKDGTYKFFGDTLRFKEAYELYSGFVKGRFKLLLRPLPDITTKEAVKMCELKSGTKVGQVEVLNVRKHRIDFIDGTMDSGDGWCEMRDKEVLFEYINAEQVRLALSFGLDLFGLIESGLAIDKTKLNSEQSAQECDATKA